MSFSQAEAEAYLRVHKEAKAAFEDHLREGSLHVSKHLLTIMSLLGPLRRCCSGGSLHRAVSCSRLVKGVPCRHITSCKAAASLCNRHLTTISC